MPETAFNRFKKDTNAESPFNQERIDGQIKRFNYKLFGMAATLQHIWRTSGLPFWTDFEESGMLENPTADWSSLTENMRNSFVFEPDSTSTNLNKLEFIVDSFDALLNLKPYDKEEHNEIEIEKSCRKALEGIKAVSEVRKILVDVSEETPIKMWTVVSKETQEVRHKIYGFEKEIIRCMAKFKCDMDFHIITEDMVDIVLNQDIRTVYKTTA